ncbi:RNA recognition motif domain-containing protein [Oceanisphaera psychrotolerans]|uniref:RNA-binding protein n=1 Tax=Oceanisphaera psychrotolerans TaxID=1414654 RepID=A0A1J4QD82_9GAMM|nr:RNA-binding protein [Oceanisphaera psychrotolerans]OIN09598.1 RNA-binding protein [Oceanisphaera psychrotolerans]
MKLSQYPVYIQSALLALGLALVGYVVIGLTAPSLSPAILFALGLLLGGLLTPLFTRPPVPEAIPTTTLYVGNLPYRANEASVRTLFEGFGQVLSVRLMKDKHTGKRRGFGFVEMPSDAARAAQQALNESEFQQRTLKVREANERKDDEEGSDDQGQP